MSRDATERRGIKARFKAQVEQIGRSFRNRNFRLFMVGHGISHTGMWIQQTAELWAIVELTNSGIAVGLHSVFKFGPVLLFGAYGGLLTDRMNRRTLLIITQSTLTLAAAVIAVAAVTDSLSLPLIYGVVLAQGLVNAVDHPLRRGFVRDLAGDKEITNALSLSSGVATVTRTLGPAIAGLLIAGLGIGWCFIINAVSYLAVIATLLMIDRSKLRQAEPVPRRKRQLREGFRYAFDNRRVRISLLMAAFVSMFAWNWQSVLPLYTTETLGGDATLFGLLVSTLSIGSLVGAIFSARIQKAKGRHLVRATAGISISLLALSLAPGIPAAVAALLLLGSTGTLFIVASQARIQLNTDDALIGRMMSMFSIGWQGARPVGAMLAGFVIDLRGPQAAFAVGCVAVTLITVFVALRGPGSQVRERGSPILRGGSSKVEGNQVP